MKHILHLISSNIGKIFAKEATKENKKNELSKHVQRILNFTVGNFCYGPLKSKVVDSEKIMVCSNWKQGKREPVPGKEDRASSFPFAATCSPFVGLILGLYLKASKYKSIWGRSITTALKENSFLKKNSAFRYKSRKVSFDKLPKIDSVLTVALYRSHVVLIINADKVNIYHPKTKKKCTGLWVLAADGSRTIDDEGTASKRDDIWYFNTKGLVFEPASVRGERQKGYRDKYKKINLVRIKEPTDIPGKLPVAVCSGSLKILKEKGYAR
jgi:hypothetical protein